METSTTTNTCTCTQKPPPLRGFLCRVSSFGIYPGNKELVLRALMPALEFNACDTKAWVVVGALQGVLLLELCFLLLPEAERRTGGLDVVFNATEEPREPVRFCPAGYQHVPLQHFPSPMFSHLQHILQAHHRQCKLTSRPIILRSPDSASLISHIPLPAPRQGSTDVQQPKRKAETEMSQARDGCPKLDWWHASSHRPTNRLLTLLTLLMAIPLPLSLPSLPLTV